MVSNPIRINPKTDVSITVDVQPTFMPGGGLPVQGGHLIVPAVLRCEGLFPREKRFATLDRHPRGHISLASSYEGLEPATVLTLHGFWAGLPGAGEDFGVGPGARFSFEELCLYLGRVGSQILWPDHAIEGTQEAEFHPSLHAGRYAHVQIKGMDPLCDSYSGLADALGRPTGLGEHLESVGARRVFVWGLAYDFCVGWTALDAAKLGFETYVVRDATRMVALSGSGEKMDANLAAAGVRQILSSLLTL